MKAFISALALVFSCFSTFAANPFVLSEDLAGAWNYSVDTPDGVYQGRLVFTKSEDGFTGKMSGQAGETDLKDLKVENNEVSFSVYAEGYLVKVKGTVNGDTFEGKVQVDYEYYTIKAKKMEVDSPAGSWDFQADTPEGVYTGQFVFAKEAGNYTGKMVMQGNSSELKDLKVENNQVSFSVYAQGYYVKVKGAVEGNAFSGSAMVEGESFPVKAERAQ